MSDTLYNARQYIRFDANEFIAIIITALFATIALSMRELLFTNYGEATSIQSAAVMFIFLLFIILVSVYLCKIVAIRIGIVIKYQAHLLGLALCLIFTLVSAGYLPLFLPGGFRYEDHVRLRIGKWPGNVRRSWETGLVAGSFPLATILFVLIFSPLYLATQHDFYSNIIVACCMIALYSLIPLPFWHAHKGAVKDWWRHLRDCTFGLDILYSSRFWYATLAITIILFSLLAVVLTLVGSRVGIVIYLLSLLLAFAAAYVHGLFFKAKK